MKLSTAGANFKHFFDSFNTKPKTSGGSLASDNVVSSLKLHSGGREKSNYRLCHSQQGGLSTAMPAASLDTTLNNMPNSMQTTYAQPLTPVIPTATNMIYPSYYADFYPLLTQSAGRRQNKTRN